ncbi:helix-turn-helix domain-containing protein [Ectothiorhodospiraceae bacterium WFHF3C12]|nr:helix-turn-helix domain-containing protein [Ectothiorhodospiraceae bacterium WFHF3C12]
MPHPTEHQVLDLKTLRVACSDCRIIELCLPHGIDGQSLERFERLVGRYKLLARGSLLYAPGRPLRDIYMVRSGAVEVFRRDADGRNQVLGFHLPGEMTGLEAIGPGTHVCTAIALETTSVCPIRYDRIADLAAEVPALQRQLMRILSGQHYAGARVLDGVTQRPADERVAALLVNFADRYARLQLSTVRLPLPMSRGDLANYLGMTPATLSRVFARFRDKGLIRDHRREVVLLQPANVRAMVPGPFRSSGRCG